MAFLLEHCSADELAHLASAKRGRSVERRPRLSAEAAGELAELLLAGHKPTIGWFRRAAQS